MNQVNSSADYSYKANVFIWNTTVGDEEGTGTKVGHASIELCKRSGDSDSPLKERYFSFRPKYPLLVNPFLFFLPFKAKLNSSLNEDRIHEGSNQKLKDADQTVSIPLTKHQYQRMQTKMNTMEKEISEGKLLYHLFPKLSVLPVAKALASRRGYEALSECPFSGLSMNDDRYEDMKEVQLLRASHCALTVNEILLAGDASSLTTVPRFSPWVITPTDLARSLQRD